VDENCPRASLYRIIARKPLFSFACGRSVLDDTSTDVGIDQAASALATRGLRSSRLTRECPQPAMHPQCIDGRKKSPTASGLLVGFARAIPANTLAAQSGIVCALLNSPPMNCALHGSHGDALCCRKRLGHRCVYGLREDSSLTPCRNHQLDRAPLVASTMRTKTRPTFNSRLP